MQVLTVLRSNLEVPVVFHMHKLITVASGPDVVLFGPLAGSTANSKVDNTSVALFDGST